MFVCICCSAVCENKWLLGVFGCCVWVCCVHAVVRVGVLRTRVGVLRTRRGSRGCVTYARGCVAYTPMGLLHVMMLYMSTL